MVYFQSLTQLYDTLGTKNEKGKRSIILSSKRKNLPHCSNLKVRHKAPKTNQNMYHKAIHNHKDKCF